MDFPPSTVSYAVVFFSIFLLSLTCSISSKRRAAACRPPPSPRGLPIIGNLHQLSSLSHRSLRALSQQHGPLMLLRLGQVPTLVVSSAAAAEELIKAHDVALGGRPTPAAVRALDRDGRGITFESYGDYWRQAKKACIVHLLNPRRVREFRPAREEEVARLLAAVAGESSSSSSAGGAVDLTRTLSCFANAVVCRTLFGRKQAADRGTMERITELIGMQAVLLGGFQVDDFFPSLAWLSLFTGKSSKLKEIVGYWYAFLDGIVDAHLRRRVVEEESTEKDFVDSLLSLRGGGGGTNGDFVPSMADIKVILMDLISAGTDTSQGTLVWAMTELVRSPADMKRLQEEVRDVAEGKPMVTEDDVERMPFLKATVKETLRLHPPAPLLIPRVAMKPVQLRGYDDVPANTQVLINAWAIARDPDSWECPEEFKPERFLGSSVDFRGNDFQFIPFGAGRRICPGVHFAATTVELTLANLLHRFDWGLPEGMNREDLDVEEAPGLTVKTKASLRLVAKPHFITSP